jgi:hypothetical protein
MGSSSSRNTTNHSVDSLSTLEDNPLGYIRPLLLFSYTRASHTSNNTSITRRFLLVAISRDDEELEFDRILQRLFDLQEPQGTPPASSASLESLPKLIVDDTLKSTHTRCCICFEDFEVGKVGVQLPCHHFFDKHCAESWLKLHNTCPVCRYELPVEDDEYEKDRAARMASRQISPLAQTSLKEETTDSSETPKANSCEKSSKKRTHSSDSEQVKKKRRN